MFKLKTFKGRKWFFSYSTLITTIFLVIFLFGSVYSTIYAEYYKETMLEAEDIGGFGRLIDLSYETRFSYFSDSDVSTVTNFISNISSFSDEYNFTPYMFLSFEEKTTITHSDGWEETFYTPKQFNFTTSNRNFSAPIYLTSLPLLNWMFPDKIIEKEDIFFSNTYSIYNNLEINDTITLNNDSSILNFTFSSSYSDNYNVLRKKIEGALIDYNNIESLYDFFEGENVKAEFYIDISSTFLDGIDPYLIDDYRGEIEEMVEDEAVRVGLSINKKYGSTRFVYEDLIYAIAANLFVIEAILFPSLLILGFILWIIMKEGTDVLKKELHMYYTRGAKKEQFVKHYSIIHIIIDSVVLLFLSGIGELITQISSQNSSFLISFVGGIMFLIPIEIIKIVTLNRFTKERFDIFQSEYKKKEKKRKEQKELSLKSIILLSFLGILFLVYSFVLPYINPNFFSSLILVTRIVAGVIFFIVVTLFSIRINLTTSLSIINKTISKTDEIKLFLQKMIISKRKGIKLFIMINFWLILITSFAINSVSLYQVSESKYAQNHADVSFLISHRSFVNTSEVNFILSDEDVASYVQEVELTTQESIEMMEGFYWEEETWRDEISFVSLKNITATCPDVFNLENSKGKEFNFQEILQDNRFILASRDLKKGKDYALGDNISLAIRPKEYQEPINFTLSEEPINASFTIFDFFDYFPFISNNGWDYNYKYGGSTTRRYYYVADISLLEEYYGDSFFSSLYIKLKEGVDPMEWYMKIEPQLGIMKKEFVIRVKGERVDIEDYGHLDVDLSTIVWDIPKIEAFILTFATICFTLFYFQSIIDSNKKSIFIAIARGIEIKKLRRNLIMSTFVLLTINVLLGFLVGTVLSALFHLGVYTINIKIYSLSTVAPLTLFFLLFVLGMNFLVSVFSYSFVKKKFDTSIITQMGEQILGE